MFKEGGQVKLLVELTGIGGKTAPAGTIGTVVDATHAPNEYAVDIRINGQYDNLVASANQLTIVTPNQN